MQRLRGSIGDKHLSLWDQRKSVSSLLVIFMGQIKNHLSSSGARPEWARCSQASYTSMANRSVWEGGLHENSVHPGGRRRRMMMMMMMRIATEVAGGNVRGKGIHWLTCIYNNLKVYAHVLLWVVGFSCCPVWEGVEIKLFKIFGLVVRSKEGLTCIRNLRKGKPRRR